MDFFFMGLQSRSKQRVYENGWIHKQKGGTFHGKFPDGTIVDWELNFCDFVQHYDEIVSAQFKTKQKGYRLNCRDGIWLLSEEVYSGNDVDQIVLSEVKMD